jgi:hypothetical protein
VTWAPDYCTSAELKSYLRITDTADDTLLALWITTVSRNVDDFTGRQFGKVAAAEDRYYPGLWDSHERALFIEIDDVQDATGLIVTDPCGNAVASTDYKLMPRNAPARGRPYERIRIRPASWSLGWPSGAWPFGPYGPWPDSSHEYTVHALYGWTAAPSAVKTGMFLQGGRLAARRDSPFGISGSPQMQGEIRLLAQLDPDFRTSLKPFVREWWAA